MKEFLNKMKGVSKAPPRTPLNEVARAFAGSCVALAFIAALHEYSRNAGGLPLLMAPFGASAVLVFGAFRSPLAQPRNVVGGHVVSALIGVTVFYLVGDAPLLAASLAVPAAIAVMHLTGTLHPPGGATAFIAATGGGGVETLGYLYAFAPCATGSAVMIAVALIVNNLPKKQQYPQFW